MFQKIQEASKLAKSFEKNYSFWGSWDKNNIRLQIKQMDKFGCEIIISEEDFMCEYRKLKKELEFFENRMIMKSPKLEPTTSRMMTMEERKERGNTIKETTKRLHKMAETLEGYIRTLNKKGIYGEERNKS